MKTNIIVISMSIPLKITTNFNIQSGIQPNKSLNTKNPPKGGSCLPVKNRGK